MSAIFDSHVHAWNSWPYDDSPTRPASGDALLEAMGQNGVSRALIVCADIDRSADNNAYVAELVREEPNALAYAIDSDSIWSTHHHTDGAVDRLKKLVDEFPDAVAVTHYVDPVPDDWFFSSAGSAWLGLVSSHYGVLSLSADPAWAPLLLEIAQAHPDLTILWHHLAGMHVGRRDRFPAVAAAAEAPNIALKLSGFHYASATSAPWADVSPLLDDLYSVFGARRLCWGSDVPASLRYTDYRTSLAAATAWIGRLDEPERAAIMGGNLWNILSVREAA